MDYATLHRAAWKELVAESRLFPSTNISHWGAVAESSDSDYKNLIRKVKAIEHVRLSHLSDEQIGELGQREVLSRYATSRISRSERTRKLSFILPGSLIDAASRALDYLGASIGQSSSEGRWEFLVSFIEGKTPAQLRHEAGQGRTR